MNIGNDEIKVEVETKAMLEALDRHLSAHAQEYAEAEEEYWHQVTAELATGVKRLTATIEKRGDDPLALYFETVKPQNREKEYNAQIDMFEHALAAGQATVELTSSQFNEVIRDEFRWAIDAKLANSTYAFK